MILTGPAIEERIASGEITIEPYDPSLVGPNSVDLRLANMIGTYNPPSEWLDMLTPCPVRMAKMTNDGELLRPGTVYLASTLEKIGSNHFVPIVEGRSSVGRLGIRIHQTAGFCDTGFLGNITLEIDVVQPVVIYPGLPVCQVYFMRPEGKIRLYSGRYRDRFSVGAVASRMHDGVTR